jgi:rSAM/selenodomain-associated transferase 2/rSAM/selenodomain-associated transferase 1
VEVEVRFEGADEAAMKRWLGPDMPCRPQGEGGLGERMRGNLRDAFLDGMDRAILVGIDIPGMNEEIAGRALDLLNREDLVFGPAEDGGYYLVGTRRDIAEIFSSIEWGTPGVLESTLQVATKLHLRPALVDRLGDVDRPEDLPCWEEIRRSERMGRPWLSVIIPAINEAENVADTISALRGVPGVEIIVVDGGSTDGTPDLGKDYGALVLRTEPGRARQMNSGAECARGEILLFLHADTWLPPGFDAAIRAALDEPGAVAGAFELHIDAPGRSLRLIDRAANWRSRRLGMPYGDQGIFMPARVFRDAGGFPDLPIMEDYEMMRRLRKKGRIVIPRFHSLASPRRWLRVGPWKNTLINQVVIFGYHLGVDPSRLAALYCKTSAKG